MAQATGRSGLDLRAVSRRLRNQVRYGRAWQFPRQVALLIWQYRGYSALILIVTLAQELTALWPVSLLGQFVDRLDSGNLGNIVWLFMFASVLYPGIVRANTILRHKMFYETDLQKRVELTLKVAVQGESTSVEAAGVAHTAVVNAVSGITNATFYVLGNFTPIIIKVTVVVGNLLSYNRLLGLTYLASLIVPGLMTILFNRWLRVLLDAQYSVINRTTGAGVRIISERGSESSVGSYREAMRYRTNILFRLVTKSQTFLYLREVALVGSQFLVVFLALHMRKDLGMTAGDFTKIIGYTTQVAAAFITTASVLDAIVSYYRAYHVFAEAHER
jgi:hypothetical protein